MRGVPFFLRGDGMHVRFEESTTCATDFQRGVFGIPQEKGAGKGKSGMVFLSDSL